MIVGVFFLGWVVLLSAIILNFIAKALRITTWYDFLQDFNKKGVRYAFDKAGFIGFAFLFVIYPASLGFVAYFFSQFFLLS